MVGMEKVSKLALVVELENIRKGEQILWIKIKNNIL